MRVRHAFDARRQCNPGRTGLQRAARAFGKRGGWDGAEGGITVTEDPETRTKTAKMGRICQ